MFENSTADKCTTPSRIEVQAQGQMWRRILRLACVVVAVAVVVHLCGAPAFAAAGPLKAFNRRRALLELPG
jgi:hypothetical protein